MDVAASEFYRNGKYDLDFKSPDDPARHITGEKLGELYKNFIKNYPGETPTRPVAPAQAPGCPEPRRNPHPNSSDLHPGSSPIPFQWSPLRTPLTRMTGPPGPHSSRGLTSRSWGMTSRSPTPRGSPRLLRRRPATACC